MVALQETLVSDLKCDFCLLGTQLSSQRWYEKMDSVILPLAVRKDQGPMLSEIKSDLNFFAGYFKD